MGQVQRKPSASTQAPSQVHAHRMYLTLLASENDNMRDVLSTRDTHERLSTGSFY